MSSQLPPPPPSPSASPSPAPYSNPDLILQLDDLLASYLNLLDTYTTLRTHLSTRFSSGFFALATANRNAAAHLGVGRTFGRDQYDERMRSCVVVGAEKRKVAVDAELGESESEHTDVEESARTETEVEQDTKHLDKLEPIKGTPDCKDDVPSDLEYTRYIITSPSSSSTKSKDPIRQFHSFPPPPLCQTQTHFKQTVQDTIPSLLTTISQMAVLEKHIWDVRRQLGIMSGYDHKLESATQMKRHDSGAVSNTLSKRKASMKTSSSSAKPSVQTLVSRSRPLEPRSRVLKVD
jgi:coiled-coil domain-containing protein 115